MTIRIKKHRVQTGICIKCKSEFTYIGYKRPIKYCGDKCQYDRSKKVWNINNTDIINILETEYIDSTGRKAQIILALIQIVKNNIPSSEWPTIVRKKFGISVLNVKSVMREIRTKYWYKWS